MYRDKFFNASVGVFCVMFGMTFVSCKKDNPVAPAGINFHITNPKNGAAFDMGTQVTVRWTLPADGSIDTVIVYRILMGQPKELLNQYMPVIAPADSFLLYISSDAPGQDLKLGIQNKVDTTQFDEITIHENGYSTN
jgi:hypothetical protein